MESPLSRPRIPWHVVYYVLAAFDVFTVSASLLLSARLLEIFRRSVAQNQEWAIHLDQYASLQRLAADVNAPGNDLFESQDVALESARMARARQAFDAEIAVMRRHLVEVHPVESRKMVTRFDALERTVNEMSAEAQTTFAAFAVGGPGPAGRRMAAMDRRYGGVLAALLDLRRDVRDVQQRLFEDQTTAALKLQRYEALIAVLIVLMVGGAILYGRRIAGHMGRETAERERYRLELEQQMEARTQALRESEAALAQAASEWRRTFDAIDSPVMILDVDGRLVRANATVRALAGKGSITGRLVTTMGEGEPWARASRVAAAARAARSSRWVEAQDQATGRSWDVSAYLMEPEEGGESRIIVVAKDTTRLLELRETIRREENMTAMGALVAGVAHEVRNPIFAISSTLDAFQARFGNAPELEKYFRVLRREVGRLRDLMRDLLDYGRPPQMETAAVALRDVVANAIRDCLQGDDAKVAVVNDVSAALPHVVVDPKRMAQVFHNVIHNALLHTPPGGEVVVHASPRVVDGRPWIESSVRDSGPGFRTEDLPHVFRPLFTRRPGGTGLGLAIAQRIVEKHRGVIWAGNAPQGGALVTIRLPLDPPPAPPNGTEAPANG